MELVTATFPYPPLPSVIDLLRYIEEEESPLLSEERFSSEIREFTGLWYASLHHLALWSLLDSLIKDMDRRPGPEVLLTVAFCANVMDSLDITDWAQSVALKMI